VVVKVLLAMGKVDAGSTDEHGWTPPSRAAERGRRAVMRVLLVTGKVDAGSTDKHGRTPLLWTPERGHEAVAGLQG
jgi:ankyrin repeat protein